LHDCSFNRGGDYLTEESSQNEPASQSFTARSWKKNTQNHASHQGTKPQRKILFDGLISGFPGDFVSRLRVPTSGE